MHKYDSFLIGGDVTDCESFDKYKRWVLKFIEKYGKKIGFKWDVISIEKETRERIEYSHYLEDAVNLGVSFLDGVLDLEEWVKAGRPRKYDPDFNPEDDDEDDEEHTYVCVDGVSKVRFECPVDAGHIAIISTKTYQEQEEKEKNQTMALRLWNDIILKKGKWKVIGKTKGYMYEFQVAEAIFDVEEEETIRVGDSCYWMHPNAYEKVLMHEMQKNYWQTSTLPGGIYLNTGGDGMHGVEVTIERIDEGD